MRDPSSAEPRTAAHPRPQTSGSDWLRERPRALLGIVVGLIVVVVVIVLLLNKGSQSGPAPGASVPKIGPIVLSASGLRSFVRGTLKQPVYWAGEKPGVAYELTRTTTGNVYVRYLPKGLPAGYPRPNYLIIATYPYPNALQRLKAVANGGGVTLPSGAFARPDPTYPKSVHMAFPGVNYEVEVYDPSPSVSERIAVSGAIQQVH